MTMENDDITNDTNAGADNGAVDNQSENGAAAASDASAGATDNVSGSMLDAISAAMGDEGQGDDTGTGQDGDAKPKEGGEAAADPDAKPEDGKPAKSDAQEDLTQMPEGLSTKAQERFQRLANDNKTKQAEIEHITATIQPFREALQDNGVTQEQFTLATSYIGLINKGDFKGALEIMDAERRQIALLAGMPLAGVDALADFPDLRADVDTFQITEQRALEIARQRQAQSVAQQRNEQVSQQREQAQQAQQSHNQGLQAVDAFCKDMEKTDLDFKHIEAILLPQIESGLLNGIPPARWRSIVEAQYKAIKAATASNKQAQGGFKSLRPAGSDSSAAKPKSMMEAMFPGQS